MRSRQGTPLSPLAYYGKNAFANELRGNAMERFARGANVTVCRQGGGAMAFTAFPPRIRKAIVEIHLPNIGCCVPRRLGIRQTNKQALEQFRESLLVLPFVGKVISAARNARSSHVQVRTVLLDEPTLQFISERLQCSFRLLRVWEQQVRMPATSVNRVRPAQRKTIQQLVNNMFHHELKIQASRAKLLQSPRAADVVNEILDATHIARHQHEHRLGII